MPESNFFVYIIHSAKLNKYYVGSTSNFEDRLFRHNNSKSGFTSKGQPRQKVLVIEKETRSEAIILEKKIKKRGIGRFLEDNKFGM